MSLLLGTLGVTLASVHLCAPMSQHMLCFNTPSKHWNPRVKGEKRLEGWGDVESKLDLLSKSCFIAKAAEVLRC